MHRVRVVSALLAAVLVAAGSARQPGLDRDAEKWVTATLKRMTLDEKIGQLLVSSFESTFVSSDSDRYDQLVRRVHEQHVGGFLVFGGTEPAPPVLLNPTYGTVTLGQPLAAASLINRLQSISRLPLLNTADFETGVGFRIAGATAFPRAMAFGAARDEALAREAGRITAIEARALGIHVNFAPVVDVNNNPRNPVINTRSFGEDPALVGKLAAAYVEGLQAGGVLATLKHFPGHGDTDVDSHIGLPVIKHPRERLDRIELPPFRAAIAAGAAGVMSGHIELPALDPSPGTPATLSGPIIGGLLRDALRFEGLIYTDSMGMQGVASRIAPGEAAVRAIAAGNDIVLHSPDDAAAFAALKAAVENGQIPESQVNASVGRVLRAKARVGLHRNRTISLDAVPTIIGGRRHDGVAQEVSRRSITLLKDERQQVPLAAAPGAQVLCLSALDYPTGWRIAAPGRTFIPELKKRWPNVTAIELSDRTTASELELVRAMAPRFDAVVVATFVRAASASGRMDLAPSIARLLQDLGRMTRASERPYVTVMFGNPYVATFLLDLPAVLLTYDFYDHAEQAAVRALAGEAAISGKLPITLPGLFDAGHGLERPARATSARAP